MDMCTKQLRIELNYGEERTRDGYLVYDYSTVLLYCNIINTSEMYIEIQPTYCL